MLNGGGVRAGGGCCTQVSVNCLFANVTVKQTEKNTWLRQCDETCFLPLFLWSASVRLVTKSISTRKNNDE